jgi:hypothetical protein
MTSSVISVTDKGPDVRRGIDRSRLAGLAPLAVILSFACVLIAISPHGYLGGDGDEFRYLQAARCASEHGFCAPVDHWWRRYPLVVPLGAAIRLFGETPTALMLAPLAYGLAAITLFVTLVQCQFGRGEALLAGIALVATPVFCTRLLGPNIDIPELAFGLAALVCLQSAARCSAGSEAGIGARSWIVSSGVMLGLAVQARPTSLALLPIFLLGLWALRRVRAWAIPFMAGFMIPNAIEAIGYWIGMGAPLRPWQLSLAHTRIPSSSLSPNVDLTQSPLFNPAYIAGWERSAGISVHWTVDGLLNLLLHPSTMLTFACGLLFVVLGWRRLGTERGGGRTLTFLIAGGALFFAALTYGLAIDPEPRMFLPLVAIACTCFGVFAARHWTSSQLPVAVAISLIAAKGMIAAYERPHLSSEATLAQSWATADRGRIAVEGRTSRFLTLNATIRALPVYAPAVIADRLLLIGEDDCATARYDAGLTGWPVVKRAAAFPRAEPWTIAALRRRQLFLAPRKTPVMCLFARA